jgi:myo-inositol-1(or 4)-monophosphatase
LPANDLDHPTLSEELELIASAAAQAGEIAMRYFGRKPGVWMKTGDSPVSEADLAVDEYLRDALTSARPAYGWLSEETVQTGVRAATRRTFVVDPIDGTRAFIDARSTWCVSIAIVEKGRPVAGVLDCPAKGERFQATLGGGAWKNGEALRVVPGSGTARIAGPKALVDLVAGREGGIERISYIPSLAYRLAMAADGRIDATFVKPRSHDWDLAAADLILTEAGGGLRNHLGRAPAYAGDDPSHGTLVAGSGSLLEEMSAAIKELDH